ncbi:MAG: caspase family protein, partial [Jatrophihabitantaceae bacterium]
MTRTALLIGANHGGLKGVHRDLAVMGKLLCERRFTTRICGPEQATRSGVLAAYDQLIADARPDDAIVVYYSGHGGYTGPSGVPGDGPTELQYIVPMGFTDSDEGEFLGITSAELSVRQAQLTAITDNVTVILDCCHSGLMSRGSEGVIKSIGRVSYDRVRAHLDRLEREGLRTDLVPVGGNPHAVRIVACAPQQRAYEYEYASNAHVGVLTESLAHVLAEADTAPVTWADILDRVRNRVIGLRFSQRPEVEGPSNRLPFSTEVAELLHSLPVTVLGQPNRVGLDCAPLLQVQSGDEFMLMPAGMGKADPDRRIGDLTVDSVSALSATGQVSFAA